MYDICDGCCANGIWSYCDPKCPVQEYPCLLGGAHYMAMLLGAPQQSAGQNAPQEKRGALYKETFFVGRKGDSKVIQ